MIGIAILGYGVVGAGVGKLLTRAGGQALARGGRRDPAEVRGGHSRCASSRGRGRSPRNWIRRLRTRTCAWWWKPSGGKGIAYQYTRRALEAGRHVVSSNKELVATHGDELIPLARQKGVRYLYEAAVGGGIPGAVPHL